MTLICTLKTAELYSGAGLLGEGFRQAGFSCVFAGEADMRAVRSYNTNIADVAVQWNVEQVRKEVKCDVLVAGPPCQGFSSLGKRQAHDERNRLSLCVAEWAVSSNAQVVVIENVPQFLKSTYWQTIKQQLSKHGFQATEWVLNAADFGVPQVRTRAFAILSRIGQPLMPIRTVQKYVTVRDAFAGLSVDMEKEGMHMSPIPSEMATMRFELIPPKGDKRDILIKAPEICPPSWAKIAGEATDVWGRMDYDKPSNTIRCCFQNPSKGRYIHPTANRVITLREGARLQNVPDHWMFDGDRSSIARQIGNGVPISLARVIGNSVRNLFR